MSDVWFNGVSASSLGLVVQSPPEERYPERDTTLTHVPGRNGDIIVDNNSYRNVTVSYTFAIKFDQVNTFISRTRSIIDWLCSSKGNYVVLRDTYSPETYRLAVFKDSGSFVNAYDQGTGFTVSFNCKPQKFLIQSSIDIPISTIETEIVNNTINNSKPTIKVLNAIPRTAHDKYVCFHPNDYDQDVYCWYSKTKNISLGNMDEWVIVPKSVSNDGVDNMESAVLSGSISAKRVDEHNIYFYIGAVSSIPLIKTTTIGVSWSVSYTYGDNEYTDHYIDYVTITSGTVSNSTVVSKPFESNIEINAYVNQTYPQTIEVFPTNIYTEAYGEFVPGETVAYKKKKSGEYVPVGVITEKRTDALSFKFVITDSYGDTWNVDVFNDWGNLSSDEQLVIDSEHMECYVIKNGNPYRSVNKLIEISGSEGFPLFTPGTNTIVLTTNTGGHNALVINRNDWVL